MGRGVGLMYTFFDFLSMLWERVHFLAFKYRMAIFKYTVESSVKLLYVGEDVVLADSTLSVSAGGTPSAHKWWSG